MTERELQEIAELAQRHLYHERGDVWNIDKDVNCADFTMEMGALLDGLGMAPADTEELERKAKRSEFAGFLDGLALTPEERLARDPEDALLGSMADAQAASDPDRTGPVETCQAEIDSMEERIPHHELPPRYDALVRRRDELEKGANDLEPRPLVTAPHPLAAEELKRGDIVILIDGKVRLHDRAEAVKRLLAEFALWSGGFGPNEATIAERRTFLCGRDLDAALEAAMWPERKRGAD